MKRSTYLGSLLAIPVVVAILATIPGCPNAKDKDTPAKGGEKAAQGDKDKGKKREPFAVKTTDAVIKGRVVYDGTPPTPAKLKIDDHADKALCHQGPVTDPTWLVGKDNGVENVVVFLEPPAGKFFALDAKKAESYKEEPWIDQPYCVYQPHIVVMFSLYRTEDGKEHETGEKLLVKNSGKISHNTKISGDPEVNVQRSEPINADNTKGVPFTIGYEPQPIGIACDKHTWMTAKIRTFDHPFFAHRQGRQLRDQECAQRCRVDPQDLARGRRSRGKETRPQGRRQQRRGYVQDQGQGRELSGPVPLTTRQPTAILPWAVVFALRRASAP